MSTSWLSKAADAGLSISSSITGSTSGTFSSSGSSNQQNVITKSILNDATSDDPNPTPGYLYDEIATATHDPEVNSRLIDYLIQRLKKQSPFTKAKVLKIIRKVCYKGHVEFRRTWQRNVSIIKEHEMFKGPTDPLRGDEPNKSVREAAKEAVEAIFDTAVEKPGAHSTLSSRIKGYGNTPVHEPSSSSSDNFDKDYNSSSQSNVSTGRYSNEQSISSGSRVTKSKYEGIGNPNFRDPRNEPKSFIETVTEKVKEKVEKYSAEAATAVANSSTGSSIMANVTGSKPSWMEGGSGVPGYSYASNRGSNPVVSTGSYDPNKFTSMSGNEGPWSTNGYSSNSSRTRKNEFEPRSPKKLTSTPIAGAIGSSSYSNIGGGASDGKYEQSLIDNLCAPGGIKPIPPSDKLSEFCATCKSLNPSIIMPILLEKLTQDDWKVQHKALCVCEAILGTKGCESFADYIDNNIELIEGLIKSPLHSSVKERAKKVWSLVYEGEFEDTNAPIPAQINNNKSTSSVPAPKTKAPEPEINLLDFGSESSEPATNNSIPTNNGKLVEDLSLFSNLDVKAPSTSNGNKADNDVDLLLLGTEPIATQSAPQPVSSGFGFLSSAPTSVPIQQSPPLLIPITSTANPAPSISTGFSFLNTPPATITGSVAPIPLNPITLNQQQQQIPQITNQFSSVSLQNSFISSNIDQLRLSSNSTGQPLPVKSLNGQAIIQQPIQTMQTMPNYSMKQPIQVPLSSTTTTAGPKPATTITSSTKIDDSFSFVKDQMKASSKQTNAKSLT